MYTILYYTILYYTLRDGGFEPTSRTVKSRMLYRVSLSPVG